MIIKSMSRKEKTFDQLISYMNSEKSDDRYDIFHHCFSRDKDGLVSEFNENASHLKKRKNGNIMYHEILSFSAGNDVNREALKEGLREAALRYVNERCPQNMVYGCLHDDHQNHLHYHLMMSANMRGESKRLRLTRQELSQIKKDAESYVLSNHPEFEQKSVMNAKDRKYQKEKFSTKASGMKRRAGKLPERERVLETIKQGMSQSASMDEFVKYLAEQDYSFYVRGKNFGVKSAQKNGKQKSYRFATLGIHEDFIDFQSAKSALVKASEKKQHKETGEEPSAEKRTQASENKKPSANEKEKTKSKHSSTKQSDTQKTMKARSEQPRNSVDETELKIDDVHREFKQATQNKADKQKNGQKSKT